MNTSLIATRERHGIKWAVENPGLSSEVASAVLFGKMVEIFAIDGKSSGWRMLSMTGKTVHKEGNEASFLMALVRALQAVANKTAEDGERCVKAMAKAVEELGAAQVVTETTAMPGLGLPQHYRDRFAFTATEADEVISRVRQTYGKIIT